MAHTGQRFTREEKKTTIQPDHGSARSHALHIVAPGDATIVAFVGPSILPICTRCCFTMTNMIQVCSNISPMWSVTRRNDWEQRPHRCVTRRDLALPESAHRHNNAEFATQ